MTDTRALTLPDPSTAGSLALVESCRAVYEQRDELIGRLALAQADELRRRSSAIEEYLRGTEAYPDAQRAARVLEMAVGAALRKAKVGRPANETFPAGKVFDAHLRHEFRTLHAGRERIEPYLETDGLSREAALRIAKGAHVSANAGENDWYTPAEYVQAARDVMGGIDLDPASTAVANEVIGAMAYYGPDRDDERERDGLSQPWRGCVWMNPPYAQPLFWRFCEKLSEEVAQGNVEQACALVNNVTETVAFQRMAEVAGAICFPSGRVRFWHPVRESAPLQGQAVVYFGDQVEAFRAAFVQFGFTVAL